MRVKNMGEVVNFKDLQKQKQQPTKRPEKLVDAGDVLVDHKVKKNTEKNEAIKDNPAMKVEELEKMKKNQEIKDENRLYEVRGKLEEKIGIAKKYEDTDFSIGELQKAEKEVCQDLINELYKNYLLRRKKNNHIIEKLRDKKGILGNGYGEMSVSSGMTTMHLSEVAMKTLDNFFEQNVTDVDTIFEKSGFIREIFDKDSLRKEAKDNLMVKNLKLAA